MIGTDGLLEIKCPTTATHIDTLLADEIPEKHIYQMLWQMACTGRKWCDFVSYDSRLPPEMQMFVRRLHRDDKEIERVENEVRIFQGEVDTLVNALKAKFKRDS